MNIFSCQWIYVLIYFSIKKASTKSNKPIIINIRPFLFLSYFNALIPKYSSNIPMQMISIGMNNLLSGCMNDSNMNIIAAIGKTIEMIDPVLCFFMNSISVFHAILQLLIYSIIQNADVNFK